MNIALAIQWGYKESTKINTFGGQMEEDRDKWIDAFRYPDRYHLDLLGYELVVPVAEKTGSVILPSGEEWNWHDWVGAHAHVMTGASAGSTATISAQSTTGITLFTDIVGLVRGDMVRIAIDPEVLL